MSAVLPGLGTTRDCTWARILSVENRICSSCRESSSSSVSNAVTLSAFPSFSTVYWRNGYGGVSLGIQALSPSPFCKPPNTGGCHASQSLLAVGMIIVSQVRLSRGRVWPAKTGAQPEGYAYLSGPGERGRSELLEFIQSLVERLIAWNALLLGRRIRCFSHLSVRSLQIDRQQQLLLNFALQRTLIFHS